MHNDFERNKRIYPVPYMANTSAPIPLPPAEKGTTGGKGSGQDGWESLDGVVEGPVQTDLTVGARIKCIKNNPGARIGMLGHITKQSDAEGYYQVEWDGNAERWRVKASDIEVISNAPSNDMDNEGPIQRTKHYITKSEAARMRKTPRWPDSGIAMPTANKKPDFQAALARGLASVQQATKEVVQDVKNMIYPREVGEDGVMRDKKIHQHSLSESIDEDFVRTSIDNEDMNDWAGLSGYDVTDADDGSQFAEAMLALSGGEYEEDEDDSLDRDAIGSTSTDDEDDKYETVYSTENDYRSEGFYSNLFASKSKAFTWILPGYLAAGPHPIYTSHLEDLSELKQAGIKAIVTLFDKPLDPKYLEMFSSHLFVPTVEGFASDLQRICKFIATQESLGNPVFIHSLHGRGRVGTAIAAYFMHRKFLNGAEEAMAYVKQNYHPEAIETVYQEDALLKFMLDE